MMNEIATRWFSFALILIIATILLLSYNGYNCCGNIAHMLSRQFTTDNTTHMLSHQFNNDNTSNSGSSGISLPPSFASHYSVSKEAPLSNDALNLFYSSFQCVNGNPGDIGTEGSWKERQCIFHNVCVQRSGSSSLYIADYFYPASITSLSSTVIRANSTFLALRHGQPDGGSKIQVRLVPLNHSNRSDPNRNLHYLNETYLMYQILADGDMNFGHVIFDDAFGLYAILKQFRATEYNSPNKNHVLVFRPCEDFSKYLSELCVKFTKGIFPVVTSHPVRSIDSLFNSSVNSNRICFRELVAGQGAAGAIGWEPENFNRGQIFSNFRSDLLLAHGINPNIIPKQHHILLVNKKGRRKFHNIHEIYNKILSTPRYAEIKVTIVDDFRNLTITQQLQLFQTVTIAISPCGGISMFFFFLPRQSALIITGYPYLARLEAPLWDYITHLHIMHYQIQSKDEFILRPEHASLPIPLRNYADIILKTEKLFPLIDKAIIASAMKSS
ncbi:unnamed protein product [Adineta steineri]|uniref:Glycosyltransferase 61 catalytic domain-containing protein n=1 Tax=Adineta steineri TaxID=433720 RepID=A0A814JCM7_9BILA|nr:unnamed protein product [Adineta steineri]CAF1357789.1 unnamed protein product [Adineta steineri]